VADPAPPPLRLGTRTSPLAAWQAECVAAALRAAWPGLEVELVPFVTEGDRDLSQPLPELGGKGVFTADLERALREGRIDLAVHSLKDLPTDDPEGLTVGAVPPRGEAGDGWVCPAGLALADVGPGAVVGTSSPRRTAQLLRARPDLRVRPVRGNVGTRLRKADEGQFDAVVLALAGLRRLGLAGRVTEALGPHVMLPAPGQGALAVQVRAGDAAVAARVAALDHGPTRMAVEAERHFLAALGGGCSAPIAALGVVERGWLTLHGRVVAADGSEAVDVVVSHEAGPYAARSLGRDAAEEALRKGAGALLP
jgi:hydroxymethylbilane synthase